MGKFKVGDKVRRVKPQWGNHEEGTEVVISSLRGLHSFVVKGDYCVYDLNSYELIEESVHPHDEVIREWLDGKPIEVMVSGKWVQCQDVKTRIKLRLGLIPFHPEAEYRIKPAKSTNQLRKEAIQKEMLKLSDELEELEVK